MKKGTEEYRAHERLKAKERYRAMREDPEKLERWRAVQRQYQRNRRAKDPAYRMRQRNLTKQWREANPQRVKTALKAWNEANPERRKELREQDRKNARSEVIASLTNGQNACVGCGNDDINVLCIDHIHNDGSQDRRRGSIYVWLRARLRAKTPGIQDRFQVLCHNCNHRKELGRRQGR